MFYLFLLLNCFLIFVADICPDCITQKREKEDEEKLKYDRASIYIQCCDDNDDKSENDEVCIMITLNCNILRQQSFNLINKLFQKKVKVNSSRACTRTRRKNKDCHELKVSSCMTVKDVKVMVGIILKIQKKIFQTTKININLELFFTFQRIT